MFNEYDINNFTQTEISNSVPECAILYHITCNVLKKLAEEFDLPEENINAYKCEIAAIVLMQDDGDLQFLKQSNSSRRTVEMLETADEVRKFIKYNDDSINLQIISQDVQDCVSILENEFYVDVDLPQKTKFISAITLVRYVAMFVL